MKNEKGIVNVKSKGKGYLTSLIIVFFLGISLIVLGIILLPHTYKKSSDVKQSVKGTVDKNGTDTNGLVGFLTDYWYWILLAIVAIIVLVVIIRNITKGKKYPLLSVILGLVFAVIFIKWVWRQVEIGRLKKQIESGNYYQREPAVNTPQVSVEQISMGSPTKVEPGKVYGYYVPAGNVTFSCGIRGKSVESLDMSYSFGNSNWTRRLTPTSWDIVSGHESSCGNVYYSFTVDKVATIEFNRY